MMGNPFGWSYPPGVTEAMLPGNSAQDAAWERLFDQVPDTCPKCKQPTQGDGEHGLAQHVRVIGEDSCSPEIRCEFENADEEPCEETLADSGRCGCRECKGEDF